MRILEATFCLLVVVVVSMESPALAQNFGGGGNLEGAVLTQDVAPNGDSDPTNVFNDACTTACSATTCETDVDEDPDGTPDNLVVASTTTNSQIIFDFETPDHDPDRGGFAQAFHIRISRCDDDASCTERDGGDDPTFNIILYCGATQEDTLATEDVTSQDMDFNVGWTMPGTCADDGSDVRMRLNFHESGPGGPNRNLPCLEALEWEVQM